MSFDVSACAVVQRIDDDDDDDELALPAVKSLRLTSIGRR